MLSSPLSSKGFELLINEGLSPTDALYKNSPFCEGRLYQPEYVNAFSALFAMGLFGLLGLFRSQYKSSLIRCVSALLFINGIASFSYHWTLYNILGSFDVITMISAIYLAIAMAYDILLERFVKSKLGMGRLYEILFSISCIIFLFLMSITVSALSVTGIHIDFAYYFGFAQIFVIIALPLFFIAYNKDQLDMDDFYDKQLDVVRRYMVVGFLVALSSGLLWVLTEPYCAEHPWISYIYSHAIWHVGISYGLFLLIMCAQFFSNINDKLEPYFYFGERDSGCLKKSYYLLVPCILNRRED